MAATGAHYTIVDAVRGLTLADVRRGSPPRPRGEAAAAAAGAEGTTTRPVHRDDLCEQLSRANEVGVEEVLNFGHSRHFEPLTATADTIPSFKAPATVDGSRQHTAFLLRGLLTAAECTGVVRTATPYLAGVETQYAQHARQCKRALLRMPLLADELFARLVPHLKPSDYEGRIPLCFGQGGVWRPVGLNEVVKVMSYSADSEDHFGPHRDGPWLPREDQASLFTVIVYLNDGFVDGGGATELYGDTTTEEAWCQDDDASCPLEVAPVQGAALVFNHDCIHAGARLRGPGEVKFVLRTEVIFERVAAAPAVAGMADRYCHVATEGFASMLRRYRESQALCDAGDRDGFMREYQQVILEQRAAADEAAAELRGATEGRSARCPLFRPVAGFRERGLNADALGDVLRFLSDAELLAVMATSAASYYAVVTSPMWRPRAVDRFGESLPRTLRAALPAVAANDAVPWLPVYRQHKAWARRFAPAILWPLSCGSVLRTHECLPENVGFMRTGDRLYGISMDEDAYGGDDDDRRSPLWTRRGRHLCPFDRVVEPSAQTDAGVEEEGAPTVLHHRLPDLFGGLHSSYPEHVNMPNHERYTVGYARRRACTDDRKRDAAQQPYGLHGIDEAIAPVCSPTGMTELSALVACFDVVYDTPWSPLVIVDHPLWGLPPVPECQRVPEGPAAAAGYAVEPADRPSADCAVRPVATMRALHVRDAMEVFRAPAVCCLSIAECVVARLAAELGAAADDIHCVIVMHCTAGLRYLPAGERGGGGTAEAADVSPYVSSWALLKVRHGRAVQASTEDEATDPSSPPSAPGVADGLGWTRLPDGFSSDVWDVVAASATTGSSTAATATQSATDPPSTLVLLNAAAEGVCAAGDDAFAKVCRAVENPDRRRRRRGRVVTMNTASVVAGAAIVAKAADFRTRCVFRHAVDDASSLPPPPPPAMFR